MFDVFQVKNTYFGPQPPENLDDMDSGELNSLIENISEIRSNFAKEEKLLKTQIRRISDEMEDGECSDSDGDEGAEPTHSTDKSKQPEVDFSAKKAGKSAADPQPKSSTKGGPGLNLAPIQFILNECEGLLAENLLLTMNALC